jgi:hypothetical protein
MVRPFLLKSSENNPLYLYLFIAANRKKLAQSEPKLVSSLVTLMDSPSLKVQCQAALALRNLASDGLWSAIILILFFDAIFRKVPTRNCQG